MISGYSVRPATMRDGPRISALLAASYPALMKDGYEEDVLAKALPLMVRANPTLLRSGTYYVAETAAEQAVGCGGWTRERPGTGETAAGIGHIRHFATHPGWVGRGIATALFERCRADALAARLSAFECNASLNAVPFYETLGFVAVAPISVPMGAGVAFPSVLMRLRLRD